MEVSVVIPVLNDAVPLRQLLEALAGAAFEIIVVDGGSQDQSAAVAAEFGTSIVVGEAGRGPQLDAGVRRANGEMIWMLHADAHPSQANIDAIAQLPSRPQCWGCFNVELGADPWLRLVALAMNVRSAISGICTGDQGIFVHRHLLWAVGGVPRQPLMEDVELCKRLRRLARPLRPSPPLGASARRWHERGLVKTVLSMWLLRLRYALGASPETLHRKYYE